MLQLLHIENIAIIECADIAFRPGFNALTGETGAGKSIVIDSISAVLGQRTSRDLIRTGADMAFVSACFTDIPPRLGEDLGIAWEGELLLQREIHGDGKNVCRVNGRPVTVTQLRTLGSRLLNIHGQHDGQQLLDEEQHLLYLDSFGRTEQLLAEYREKYQAMAALRRQMQALEMDEAEKARRVDTLTYQLQELERAKLRPGEEEELQSRRTLLHNAEKFISAVSGADFCLNGDDGSDGAANLVRQAQGALAPVRGLDPELGELYDRLEAAYSEIYDLADTIRDKREDFDFSPKELDRVEGRLDQLYRLKKKYGPTVEEMLEYQARCRRELDQIQDAGDTLLHLEKQLKKAEKAARQAAESLSQARHEAAGRLEEQNPHGAAAAGHGQDSLRHLLYGAGPGGKRHGPGTLPDVRQRGRGAAPHPQDRLRRRAGPHHAGHEKRPVGAGSGGHHGVRRGGHRRVRPGRPEGGRENGPHQPHQAGAVRDPSAPAGRHGRHPLLRGKGGAGGTYLHPGGAAGPCPAPAGAGPSHRRGLHLRHHAGGSRGAAGPGGKIQENLGLTR